MPHKIPIKPKPEKRYDVYVTIYGRDYFSKRLVGYRAAERWREHLSQRYNLLGFAAFIKTIKPDAKGRFPHTSLYYLPRTV